MGIYRDCYLICRTKHDDNMTWVLDLPFQTYSNEVFCEGQRYYHQCPQKDTEVMVHISYDPKDEDKVKSFDGFMGMQDEVDKIMAHPKYTVHWKETNAITLQKIEIDSDKSEIKITPYEGIDKDLPSKCSNSLGYKISGDK